MKALTVKESMETNGGYIAQTGGAPMEFRKPSFKKALTGTIMIATFPVFLSQGKSPLKVINEGWKLIKEAQGGWRYK